MGQSLNQNVKIDLLNEVSLYICNIPDFYIEAYVEETSYKLNSWDDSKQEFFTEKSFFKIKITAHKNSKLGFSTTNANSVLHIKNAIQQAMDNCNSSKYLSDFDIEKSAVDSYYIDESTINVNQDYYQLLAPTITGFIDSIKMSFENTTCKYSVESRSYSYINSLGSNKTYKTNECNFGFEALMKTESGLKRTLESYKSKNHIYCSLHENVIEQITESMKQNCLSDAELLPSGLGVMIAPKALNQLLGYLSSSIDLSNSLAEHSYLYSHFNKQIFSDFVSIQEIPLISNGFYNMPFDKQGQNTIKKNIVNSGKLESLLLDRESSNKLNKPNTGNANGASNWVIRSEDTITESYLSDIGEYIVIEELAGNGYNQMTGLLHQVFNGFYIKAGVRVSKLEKRSFTINIINLFKKLMFLSSPHCQKYKVRTSAAFIKELKINE